MKLEIDVDRLNAKAEELRRELAQVEGLLTLARQFSIPVVEAESEPAFNGSKKRTRLYSQQKGRQKDLLLLLKTGAASFEDLQKTLKWETAVLRNALHGLVDRGFGRETNTGKVELTTHGHERADWFIKFPQYTIHQGKEVK